MNRYITCCLLTGSLALSGAGVAATKEAQRARPAPAVSESPSPGPAPVKKSLSAPGGIGPFKLGITKEAVDALPTSGDFFVSGLMEKVMKSEEGPGKKFEGKMKTPLSDVAFEATFKFDDSGLLTYLGLKLDESTLLLAEKQLAEKYGPAKVQEEATEEQCIYKNGANFKLPNSTRSAAWGGTAEDGQAVSVSAMSAKIGMCPSNLRYGGASTFTFYSLSFSRPSATRAEPPKKNIF